MFGLKLQRKNLIIIILFALVVAAAFILEMKPKLKSVEKEIEFWQYWSGVEKEPLEALVLKFNKVHSKDYGFKVKLLTISMPQKKIMMAMAGNVAPDLVHLDGGMVVDFALRNALTDISSINTDEFIPIYIEALKVAGKQYALPLMPTCEAMHVNKDLLRDFGLEIPKSLEDLVQGSRFMVQKSQAPGTKHLEPSKYWMPSWPPWTGKFMPIVFGGNWGKQEADGSWIVTANSKENIEAWTWVQDNFASKLKPGELASFTEGFSSYQSPDNPFYAGKVAIETSGVWEKNLAKIYNPNMNVEIAPFPGKLSMPTLVSVDALAIPKVAKNKKEAQEFMLWLLEQGNVESLALAQAKFSPLKEVSENFYFEHSNPYIKVFVDLANSPNAKFFPQLPFIKRYERAIKEYYDKVLRMEMSAKDALNALQEKFSLEHQQ